TETTRRTLPRTATLGSTAVGMGTNLRTSMANFRTVAISLLPTPMLSGDISQRCSSGRMAIRLSDGEHVAKIPLRQQPFSWPHLGSGSRDSSDAGNENYRHMRSQLRADRSSQAD